MGVQVSHEKKLCIICGKGYGWSKGKRGGKPFYSTMCRNCLRDPKRPRVAPTHTAAVTRPLLELKAEFKEVLATSQFTHCIREDLHGLTVIEILDGEQVVFSDRGNTLNRRYARALNFLKKGVA